MNKIIIFCSFIFIINSFFSQNSSRKKDGNCVLKAISIDSLTNTPLEYVQLRVFSSIDSTIITGIYSDLDGVMNIDSIPIGNYYVKITFSGLQSKTINNIEFTSIHQVINLGEIKLGLEKETSLEEFKVTGKKDVLKTGIDKKVYNVAEDLSSKGGNANDALNRIPSVGVDQDGKVSLRGDENVTILIDGRPSSFSGGNGKSFLDAIPASSIERIEIVTNPSAKYSPDGTSGIINVVLKKNKLKGTNGMLSTSGANGPLFNGSASFSYRNSKLNAYSSYTYRYSDGYRNNKGSLTQIFSNDSTSKLVQNRVGSDLNAGHTFRIGSDFYIRSNQTIGISATGNLGVRNREGDVMNQKYDGNSNLVQNWARQSYDPSNQTTFDINGSYKIDFKKEKGALIADFTQSIGSDNIRGEYNERYYNLDGSPNNQPNLSQQIFNLEKNNVNTAQIDYSRTFPNKDARMEAGMKSIVRNLGVNTNSQTFDNTLQVFKADTIANFAYSYNEQVYAIYGIYGQQIHKFKYQGGLRLEQAFQSPYLVSTNEKFTNNYFNFYPSGHLKYNHKANSEWSLSYSRRINRPSSNDMNPFTSYADPYNMRKGNPALRPEYINSFDLGYSIEKEKITITSSVYYRETINVIQRAKIFYPDNTSAVTFINIDQSQSAGIELIMMYKPFKWFKNVISFNGSKIQYHDNTPDFNYNNSGFTWGAKYIGTVDFWKKTMTAQLNINYIAPNITAQGTAQRRGSIDFSTEKTLKEGKWSIGFRVTDILNRQGFSFAISQPSIIQTSEFKWLTRRYYLTVSYKFGKLEMSTKKTSIDGGGGGDF